MTSEWFKQDSPNDTSFSTQEDRDKYDRIREESLRVTSNISSMKSESNESIKDAGSSSAGTICKPTFSKLLMFERARFRHHSDSIANAGLISPRSSPLGSIESADSPIFSQPFDEYDMSVQSSGSPTLSEEGITDPKPLDSDKRSPASSPPSKQDSYDEKSLRSAYLDPGSEKSSASVYSAFSVSSSTTIDSYSSMDETSPSEVMKLFEYKNTDHPSQGFDDEVAVPLPHPDVMSDGETKMTKTALPETEKKSICQPGPQNNEKK